jgi:hypothetical protein
MQPWGEVSSPPDANTVFEGQEIRHRQTRPLVREGAPQKQDLTVKQ